jgi:hypothetical protein
MTDEDSQYEVGYGKPPKNTQFPQGRSGNPKGRPKGSRNLASIVLRETREKLLVRGPRGSRKITKLEAAVMQLGNKAAQGDPRAQREFFSLVQRSEENANAEAGPLAFSEMDQQVMKNILKRMRSFESQNDSSTPEGTK